MSITVNYPFDDPNNYARDPSKIGVSGGKAQLILNLPDGTLGATYTSGIDAIWGGGSLVCTPRGGAAAVNGKLDLKGAGKSVDYQALGNADSQQAGAVRLTVIPDWSGIAVNRALFSICKGHMDSKNVIQAATHHNGQVIIIIRDSNSNVILSEMIATWNAVQGQPYEFELNWDIDSGAGHGETRLFMDGVQFGPTLLGSGTRDADIGLLRVGCSYQQGHLVDGEVDDLAVFSAVQHTANYTPGQAVANINNPTIKPNAPIGADSLAAFSAVLAAAGNDAVKFVIDVDGTKRYWNGTAWADSSGYVQSNDPTDIDANAGSLLSQGSLITPIAYLHSDDGSTTPELDEMELSYDHFVPPDADPKICIIAGYLRDPNNKLLFNTKVRATLLAEGYLDGKNYWVSSRTVTAVSSEDGYFEIDLIRSSEYKTPTRYRFVVEVSASEKYTVGDFTVPDLDFVDFDDL